MAECGICLDVLRNPVSIPCGHVHCERCLRSHISSGTDALQSTCPTCRKSFHIATPDFTFVPQKYHDFILPSVRKIYVDLPSIAAMSAEIDSLTQRLDAFTKENERLNQHCSDYKYMVQSITSEKNTIIEQEEEARREAADLRKKYDSLKKKYWEFQPRDNTRSTCNVTPSQRLSRRNSQNLETSRDIHPKVEEHPVSLQDLIIPNPPRPKRALPKSRLSNSVRRKDEQVSQLVKRQRTHRYSDAGSSSQLLEDVFGGEDEEDE